MYNKIISDIEENIRYGEMFLKEDDWFTEEINSKDVEDIYIKLKHLLTKYNRLCNYDRNNIPSIKYKSYNIYADKIDSHLVVFDYSQIIKIEKIDNSISIGSIDKRFAYFSMVELYKEICLKFMLTLGEEDGGSKEFYTDANGFEGFKINIRKNISNLGWKISNYNKETGKSLSMNYQEYSLYISSNSILIKMNNKNKRFNIEEKTIDIEIDGTILKGSFLNEYNLRIENIIEIEKGWILKKRTVKPYRDKFIEKLMKSKYLILKHKTFPTTESFFSNSIFFPNGIIKSAIKELLKK